MQTKRSYPRQKKQEVGATRLMVTICMGLALPLAYSQNLSLQDFAVLEMNAASDLFKVFESKYWRRFEILNIHEFLLDNPFPYKAKGFWDISGGKIEVVWGNAGPQSQDNFFVGEKIVMTKYRE